MVEFVKPVGYAFTLPDSTIGGADDTADSDANQTTGRTTTINLSEGENDPTWDAGLYQPITIGDTVYRDGNGNGAQDLPADNQLIPNVPITLTNVTTGQVFTTTTDTTSTYPPGNYLFQNLPPGVYSINLPGTLPLLVRSTPLPSNFLMQSGDTRLDLDFGYINPTAVEFAYAYANIDDHSIVLHWATTREEPGDMFLIYRSLSENGPRTVLSPTPIPASGQPDGAAYSFTDGGVSAGHTYFYWIQASPQDSTYGPLVVPYKVPDPGSGGTRLFIPYVMR